MYKNDPSSSINNAREKNPFEQLEFQIFNDEISDSDDNSTSASLQKSHVNLNASKATNSGELSCDICGSSFKSQAELDVHQLNHLVTETYTCEICEHVSKVEKTMSFIFRIHTRNSLAFMGRSLKRRKLPNMPYRCDICDKTFRFANSFKSTSINILNLLLVIYAMLHFQHNCFVTNINYSMLKRKFISVKNVVKIFKGPISWLFTCRFMKPKRNTIAENAILRTATKLV
ncbi:zinc finger protein 90 [Caerostris extrusa]|uniref:Zinc finger protein 90 n=1 Tax=Caerostris extrusa TaxID=172846 RepID=A0AAV4XRZ7_CAEEX|nr:zinc finger protein 90 [Caerostris extrusa]